ncbi:MAG: prepilin-type N-terminal cleavage/methylation domain-containing protein [Campylobacterota bacterium]|nr:prepilin-type N-terminal cleavage/methylation domain-containing protein [Campylobacterota bacterium]
MRKGFTLIEMIFVIIISAVLSIGSFKAIEALYIRSAKAKALTDMTLRSQIVLDQLSQLIYNRIPNSVIGYNDGGACEAIDNLTDNYTIVEWIGTMEYERLLGSYDSFIDMGDSNSTSRFLSARDINHTLDAPNVNLIFAGTFDEGAEGAVNACEGAFGWHGNDSNLSYIVNIEDHNITLEDQPDRQPEYIYEKYYLTNTAYAVARGADLNETNLVNNCSNYSPPLNNFDFDTTLFLFYNYQPFEFANNAEVDETFCGDSQGTREGNVSILAQDVTSFKVLYINRTIRLNLDMNRSIRGASDVYISKQKAIY